MRVLALVLLLVASVAQATPLKMLFPGVVSQNTAGGSAPVFVANTLYCWTVPAAYSVPSATKIAGYFSSGTGSKTVSFGIYENADAGALKISVTGVDASGVLPASSQPATDFVGGELYRVCACSSDNAAVGYLRVQQATACCQDVTVTKLMQAFHSGYAGTGANSCTGSAVLPASTGVITGDTTFPERDAPRMPIVLIEQ